MITANPNLLPARVMSEPYCGPTQTIRELCEEARIAYKYSGGDLPYVGVTQNTGNLRAVDANDHQVYIVDRNQFSATDQATTALRILEVVAHAFHDYAARECVRGLFR